MNRTIKTAIPWTVLARAIVVAVFVSSTACAGMEDAVRAQAAIDFSCSKRDIQLSSGGRQTSFLAVGCGLSATYTCSKPKPPDLSEPTCARERNVP